MILDTHIHIMGEHKDREELLGRFKTAGIDGGVLLSLSPNSFEAFGGSYTTEERLDDLFYWVGSEPGLFPFFWIDPMEEDALDQVTKANERGVKGFKVICSNYYPGDERPLKVFKAIAKSNKPILFHSGILWDGTPSSRYNRPAEFEALLYVEGLRFALAHVSWPWTDECIAVYGKLLDARRKFPGRAPEMFIDMTPGTPGLYREDVLTKLIKLDYKMSDNILFGTDSLANDYSVEYARKIIDQDNAIFQKLNVPQDVLKKIYSENLKRFIGI